MRRHSGHNSEGKIEDSSEEKREIKIENLFRDEDGDMVRCIKFPKHKSMGSVAFEKSRRQVIERRDELP